MEPTKEQQKEMEQEEQTRRPNLRLVKGGKDRDGETPSSNWLLRMERGTIFLARDKNPQTPLAEEYCLAEKTEKTATLFFDDHRGTGHVRVDAELFIRYKVLLEVLGKKEIDRSR